MLMESLYNFDKTLSAEPSLKRNIVPNAQGSKDFASISWRAQPDSLWGIFLNHHFFKKEIKMVFAKNKFPSISHAVIAIIK